MLIVTTDDVGGQNTVKVFGTVQGSIVRARHLGIDILAQLRNLVGGEVSGYSKLLTDARAEATQRMADQAESMGANAIVATRYTTSAIMGGASEILAYGTAVVIETDK